ncbi:hypothetical protein ACA910_008542 [Epithemia clementina (nom. ined.)]
MASVRTVPCLSFLLAILSSVFSSAHAGDELCVVGCTPYVDPFDARHGIEKYRAMARELAATCDLVVHLGDTMPGNNIGCNETILTRSVHILVDAGAKTVLYAPGDNELSDCHRSKSAPEGQRYPSDIVKAIAARQFIIHDLNITSGYDITGTTPIHSHNLRNRKNPATCDENGDNCLPYSCEFDKYIEMDSYAVATLEVLGNHWYLDDNRASGYPEQDTVDPLADRLALYVNAKDCALDWIDQVSERAFLSGKRAVFFMFHGKFYSGYAQEARGTGSIGQYYKKDNLERYTSKWNDPVRKPYAPLFDKFWEVSQTYKNMSFQIVHSDTHRWFSTRFNPGVNNDATQIRSHHNMMVHQTEGSSRALTMYTRFMVDPNKFQPITAKEEWSREAFNQEPKGHRWQPYKAPYMY